MSHFRGAEAKKAGESKMKKLKLMYFEGCPSWQPALQNLKEALN